LGVDENEVLFRIAKDGARGAHLLAGRGIAVAAFARKRREIGDARGDVNPRARWRFFEQRGHRVTALRVLHGASELALPTSYAPLWIDKNGFHLPLALLVNYEGIIVR